MLLKNNGNLLSIAPKYKKTAQCLMEKKKTTKTEHVFDNIYSGLSYSALSCELNINESIMY